MSVRILHVLVPEPPGEVGGADMHVRDLAVEQQSSGAHPVVVERGSREFAERLRGSGVEVTSATGVGFWPAVRWLANEIATQRPDIVHAHGYDADYWAAATRWRYPSLFRQRHLIFTQHGVVEDTLWHKGKTFLDALCMRAADGVIVCASDLTARMQRWCPGRLVQYIPNGVKVPPTPPGAAARRALGLPSDGFLVGYVGRLSPEKRPDRVLTLIADARSAGLAIQAVIVGSGPMRAELERQAQAADIRDAVHFTGYLPTVGDVYGAVNALALLSDTETTSRVVLEAMSTGVPVLASAVGGVPDLLDHGLVGWLVPRDDRRAALAALGDLMARPERSLTMAKARVAKHYSVEAMCRRVGEFYAEVRNGGPSAGSGQRVGVIDEEPA